MNTSLPLAIKISNAIRSVVGDRRVPLHEPVFQGREIEYLQECIESTFVSSVGIFVDRFESELSAYTGARHVVAVVNGTAALHVALKLSDIGNNDEVLIPALTFIATANAVTYCGAIPHFVDSEDKTLGIDVGKLREYLLENTVQVNGFCVNKNTNRKIKALVPMHAFGHPSDLDGLKLLAQEFNLILIEDAAESLGSFYKDRHTGTFGRIGVLSFNGNKTITTGGGGAILTNDPEIARQAKHITTTAKISHPWLYRHDAIGFNYRMPNLNAALGCAQLERLPQMLIAKRSLAEKYRMAFAFIPEVTFFDEPKKCISNYWLQTLILNNEFSKHRDAILKETNAAGLMTRPAWDLLHTLPPYESCPRMNLSGSEDLSRRLINIPSSSNLIYATK